ncbi:MAG: tRNA (adenosine(37)-N6)-threonylcarbamoyltransferase complex transferase subunit TsaD [Deltaproteobacteria bacterium]|nr:tRNA (adenosine(37)-N6)-threonylcarbamoyltransferase complex transferase subunit TsaD [Deltaproteobacteria bacterium]
MIVLGVETSCDDTAAAVLEDGRVVRANLVSSQDAVHAPYGGIVPEMASRQHIHAIQPMVDKALTEAGVAAADLDGLAVTCGPGLTGSLLVGLSFVKAWSFRSGIPYVGVNHLEAHVMSIFLEREVSFPYLALVASGGHTLLYLVRSVGDYEHLGGTLDDAAGEAYDKVANMMGLGFPGGRVVDDLAKQGDPRAVAFPRARLRTPYDFSFSGLKTSVWHYLTRKRKDDWRDDMADIAASFQEAVVDMLIAPTLRAVADTGIRRIVLGGGVSANSRLRGKMTEKAEEAGAELHYPSLRFCTDNGAMVALVGSHRLADGDRDGPRLNADPALTL